MFFLIGLKYRVRFAWIAIPLLLLTPNQESLQYGHDNLF